MPIVPTFSIIIPLYNKSSYVTEALASVQAQTYPPLEILVVDDGSTDDGPDRVKAILDPRIRLLQQDNAGASVARNRGIELAQGEFVLFLDADDRYLPGFLEAIVRLVDRFPSAAMYATGYFRLRDNGARHPAPVAPALKGSLGLVKNFYAAWCKSAFFYTVSLAIRRKVLVDNNMRFPPGEQLGEDQDLWFRIAERYPIAYAEVPLVEYRTGVPDSATQAGKILDVLPCYQRLGGRLDAGAIPVPLRRSARKLLASHFLNVARARLDKGDIRGGWSLISDTRSKGNPVYRFRTIGVLCHAIFRFRGVL